MTPCFIPAPFLRNAIFTEKSAEPLKLIITAKEAATFYDTSHRRVPSFENVSAKEHASAFSAWAFAVHLGQLTEVRQIIAPDDNKIQMFSDKCH